MTWIKRGDMCPFCGIGYLEEDLSSGGGSNMYTMNTRCDSCGASGQGGDFKTDSFMTRKKEELFRIGNRYRALYGHLYPKGRKR